MFAPPPRVERGSAISSTTPSEFLLSGLVMQVLTLAVVGQDLDDATFGNPPARTFADHPLQFGFERR